MGLWSIRWPHCSSHRRASSWDARSPGSSQVTTQRKQPPAKKVRLVRRMVFAQPRKELTQIVRDWRPLALALLLPLMLLFLMSTALSLTVSDLPIIVQDLDGSPASRDFIDAFRASITFSVVAWPVDKQPELAFTSNAAHAALIIPEHFGRDMARGLD